MTEQLKHNLSSKHELRFNKDGKFKILMMSDIQETLDVNPRTLPAMRKLLDKVQPDLVVLGGDNCNGKKLKTEPELREYLKMIAEPMEERKIPWMHVFGNHDHDIEVEQIQQTKMYEEHAYCVSKHTEGIYGASNYVLPVYGSNSDEVAYAVWALDTNRKICDTDLGVHEEMKLMNRPQPAERWDILHFDQLMWYWNSSVELEKHAGKKVHAAMFMHIAPWEFQYIVDNPEVTGCQGSTKEIMLLGAHNSGIFAEILQRGDVKVIGCGHSHDDSFQGEFLGITMALDACAGYASYGTEELRGGRVFEIDEKDTTKVNTYMVHYIDL